MKKIARRKLCLRELAQDLQSVSKARKVMGYSRQQFYEICHNYQTFGSQGLVDRLPGARGPHPNRVIDDIEAAILDHCLSFRKKQKLRPGDILGALTSEGGLEGNQVGKIKVFDQRSYVAVEKAMAKLALSKLNNDKLKGRRYRVRQIR